MAKRLKNVVLEHVPEGCVCNGFGYDKTGSGERVACRMHKGRLLPLPLREYKPRKTREDL